MNPNHHPPPPHLPNPNPNPPHFQTSPHDLPTALSALTDLIHLTEQTLSSTPVRDLVRIFDNNVDDDDDGFAQCPYNPTHRMPAGSLFTHYLTCPTSLDFSNILSSLRYPHTLYLSKSELVQRRDVNFEDELFFSVDRYGDFCANYFYEGCPGVVGFVQELDAEKMVFTVPRVLYLECKDFADSDELREFERSGFKLLVSEFTLGRCEVESWNDYPLRFSLRLLKMVSNALSVKDTELKKWLIVNSPSYGVVIDKAITDHIVLLLKLCLRAMAKEAFRLVKSQIVQNGSKVISESNSMNISFDCRFMNEVLGWFISQLTVLYGEVNGKYFGINMLKNCLIKAGLCSLLFPLEEKRREHCRPKECVEISNSHDCEIGETDVDLAGKQDVELDVSGKVHEDILLSQVTAAVAALYERAVLERKIRGFRPPHSLPKHQIVAEHNYLTNKAREERQKRTNYKSIVEHDGLIWQHSHSQETNRTKTREELLAEERDYKRRRMSYRGKKMKRSTTEVMRGIIEEYMEEIKQAGGIGCLVKGSEEAHIFPPEPAHSKDANASGFKNSSYVLSDKVKHSDSLNKQPHPINDRCGSVQSFSSIDYEKRKSESYGYGEHSSSRHDRDHISRSRSKDRSQGCSEDRARKKIDHKEITRPRHDTSSDRKSRFTSSTSNSRKNMIMSEGELESNHMGQRNRNTSFGDQSVSSDAFDDRYYPAFDDRYDPSNSHTMLQDDDVT
ncbi:unnamed protein product [Rhodiola kirilowii]